MGKPEIGSVWKHHNGNLYTVLLLANEYTQKPERYPVTIVYSGENGRVWSRPLADWHRSMALIERRLDLFKESVLGGEK